MIWHGAKSTTPNTTLSLSGRVSAGPRKLQINKRSRAGGSFLDSCCSPRQIFRGAKIGDFIVNDRTVARLEAEQSKSRVCTIG
jgi:hypothetical protein